MGNVLIEAVVVGATLAGILALITRAHGPIQTVRSALIIGFIVGALFHLGCEVLHVNAWYCAQR